jgi:LysR family transcriptional regulator of gallate degradation
VARHGSFSRAALTLNITQPGLTKAIRRLECEFGSDLFVRMPRGVVLTEQGRALARHARLIEVQLQDAREELGSLGRGVVGKLRVGAGPSWLGRVLPKVIAQMSVSHPKLNFRVIGGFNSVLLEDLRNGELDLVVSALPDQTPDDLHAIPLSNDRLSVVARRGHPLLARRKLLPLDTQAFDWALPGRDVLSRSRLEALFRVAGIDPPAAKVESDSISFIAAVLRNSDMLSFATSQILTSEMEGIVIVPVPGLTMRRSAGVMFRRSGGQTPTNMAFVDAIKAMAGELGTN